MLLTRLWLAWTVAAEAAVAAAAVISRQEPKPEPKADDLLLASVPGVSFRRTRGASREHEANKASTIKPGSWRDRGGEPAGVQRLRRVADTVGVSSAAYTLGMAQRAAGGGNYQNITLASPFGTQYAIDVEFDGLPLRLLLDTGSADTWAVARNYTCVDYDWQPIATAECGFGPSYPRDFADGLAIEDEHLYILYGDGEVVYGPMGYVDVTVANITVPAQQVALANTTYWIGNNQTSGICGLAYQSITDAYYGDGLEHSPYAQEQYPPLFTNMVEMGLVDSRFAVAIDRNSSGGIIAWGGVPDVPGLDYSADVVTPIVIADLTENPFTSYSYSYYTIKADGVVYGQAEDARRFLYIVDTGTTLIYLPPPLAEAVNGAFDPPATFMWMYGAYFTSCDAVAPKFAVVIESTRFYVNPVDMIYRGMPDPLTGLCMTAIASGGTGPYILGDAFLQNVLTVFDTGNSVLEFVSRRFY